MAIAAQPNLAHIACAHGMAFTPSMASAVMLSHAARMSGGMKPVQ